MEFKNVVIVNCSEGNIPHSNSIKASEIEEERRLFYVGVTRAIENLYICSTKKLKGKAAETSRFLNESFEDIKALEEAKEKVDFPYSKGEEVIHKIFGEGKIVDFDGICVTILFSGEIERKFDAYTIVSSDLLSKKG